jgi:mRNA interferase RelE/StbE
MTTLIDQLNQLLALHRVKVIMATEASKDLYEYDKHVREKILALIFKRAVRGPLIKPDGIGEPLRKELKGFAKIKPKRMGLRILYFAFQKDDITYMAIIAIGVRDKDKVYKIAAARLPSFFEQISPK